VALVRPELADAGGRRSRGCSRLRRRHRLEGAQQGALDAHERGIGQRRVEDRGAGASVLGIGRQALAQRDDALQSVMHEDEEQRRRILPVDDGERADSNDARPIHRRDRHVASECDECPLLHTWEEVIAPQLDVLPRRGLAMPLEQRDRCHCGGSGGYEKLTSVHEHLVEGSAEPVR